MAISRIPDGADVWQKLDKVSDNMLIFTVGFLSSVTKNNKVILAGGTQMCGALCILDYFVKSGLSKADPENINLMTTRWVYEDTNSDIGAILSQLSIDVPAFYSCFTFDGSNHKELKLYDTGESKEGVGLGAALCYAHLKGVCYSDIIKRVEELLIK